MLLDKCSGKIIYSVDLTFSLTTFLFLFLEFSLVQMLGDSSHVSSKSLVFSLWNYSVQMNA